MFPKSGRTKRSEKGLLTPDNCVVAIIDLQPQMLFGLDNFDRQSFRLPRRRTNNSFGVGMALTLYRSSQSGKEGRMPADSILHNAKIFSNSVPPVVQAIAIKLRIGDYGPQVE
jgi:hypothetical protein